MSWPRSRNRRTWSPDRQPHANASEPFLAGPCVDKRRIAAMHQRNRGDPGCAAEMVSAAVRISQPLGRSNGERVFHAHGYVDAAARRLEATTARNTHPEHAAHREPRRSESRSLTWHRRRTLSSRWRPPRAKLGSNEHSQSTRVLAATLARPGPRICYN